MGWFSAKKKTYVSSVAYPLGEDDGERTNSLQTNVVNALLQGQDIAEGLSQGYLRGQGTILRNAFRYARDHYTNGLAESSALYMDQPDVTALRGILLTQSPGSTVNFLATLIGPADYTWWAEEYLATNYGYDRISKTFSRAPKGVEATANVAYDLNQDGFIDILLMNADGATTILTFRPEGYQKMANYVHAIYQLVQTFAGMTTTDTRAAAEGETDSVHTTTTTVNRGSEVRVTTNRIVTTVADGVATVVTTPTTVVTSMAKYFFYLLGRGTYPALDAMVSSASLASPYFPSIPLRVDNHDWTDASHQATPLYKSSKKLLDKVGVKIADLADSVNTNQNISDIDYAFVVFGVRLNAPSPECKDYLFRYFSYLRNIGTVDKAQYTQWANTFDQAYPDGHATTASDAAVTPPTNRISIHSPKDRSNNYDVQLQWQYIDTKLVTGEVSPGAKKGTVTVAMEQHAERSIFMDIIISSSVLVLRKQIDATTYEEISVSGLTYENFIYKGHSVILSAEDVMNDPDEKGFIIPLNQEILRQMPLVQATDLAYQCMHMVFNCYKVVKQKWYQTGLFKLVIVIIAIVIIVVTWGSGTPAAASMIAAAIGGATMLAIVIAATVYVLGMMVLMSLLMPVLTKAFGPKWGALIGMVVAIYAGGAAGGATNAGTASMINASNIIQVSGALVNAWTQDKLIGIAKEADKLASDYKTGMAKVEDLTKEFLSTSLDKIDVMGFTEASFQFNYESPDDFFKRTLLTGSDICNITSGLVENFTEVGLQLPTIG